jgi:hypothetical protein
MNFFNKYLLLLYLYIKLYILVLGIIWNSIFLNFKENVMCQDSNEWFKYKIEIKIYIYIYLNNDV